MLVQLTNAGAALLAANQGPIELSTFQLGSAFGYIPEPQATSIQGTEVYSGAPSEFLVVNPNVFKYSVYLDYDLGPFQFGELGLFTSTGVLFALAANSVLIQKEPASAGVYVGNSIRLDIYLSIVGQNYAMWLDYASSNNTFAMAVLQSPDQLPQPQNAVPNAYVITGASSAQSSFLAYTSQTGLWNFDCYQFANQASASITAFTQNSITISQSQYVPGMSPAYLGATIVEFSSGALYGICRYVTSVTLSGGSAIISFDSPLLMTPDVGDTVLAFGRQALSTTIPNLPIASSTQLGGVIIGDTLTVTAQGLINVASSSFPVLSVNGQTGNVNLVASDISGFAAVATTGLYSSLIGAPAPYSLPVATQSTLGGVIAPSDGNITIAGNGVIDLGFSPVKTVNGNSPDSSGNVTVTYTPPTVIGLVNPQAITASTNFNTIQTAGLYFGLDANASTFTNAPNTTAGGVLDVEPFTTTASGGDVIQRYTQSNAMFFRRYTQSSNTWSAWIQLATSSSIPAATTSTIGGVIVGSGLSVTGGGTLSANVLSVNGLTGAAVLNAASVGALATTLLNAQGGVPSLSENGGTPNPNTDPYTYGRIPFFQNTLGVWWNAGVWDANANHVAQYQASSSLTPDPNTALLANGQQTIDISYNGSGVSGLGVPDYQTVSAEGMVYKVVTAGTTSLDGIDTWQVGDLAVGFGNKWLRVPGGIPANSLTGPSSWYRTNLDGTIEMGGVVNFPTGTNSQVVTLPISIPNQYLSGSAIDTGAECLPYGVVGTSLTTITVYAPAYFVNSSGAITARGTANAQWSILVN
jgi:hypothetical protein